MNPTTTGHGNNQQLALVSLNTIQGYPVVFNAWLFAGAQPFGQTGTMLSIVGFQAPIYVSDSIEVILRQLQGVTGLSFDNVLGMIRNNSQATGLARSA